MERNERIIDLAPLIFANTPIVLDEGLGNIIDLWIPGIQRSMVICKRLPDVWVSPLPTITQLDLLSFPIKRNSPCSHYSYQIFCALSMPGCVVLKRRLQYRECPWRRSTTPGKSRRHARLKAPTQKTPRAQVRSLLRPTNVYYFPLLHSELALH